MGLPNQYVKITYLLREILVKALHALKAYYKEKREVPEIQGYLGKDLERLEKLWPSKLKSSSLINLRRHIRFGEQKDYEDMIEYDLPGISQELEEFFSKPSVDRAIDEIGMLIHPRIKKSSYEQFLDGHLRDAVLNAIIAIFDLIREKSGMDKDGAELVENALSLSHPKIVISTLDTESGTNEQKGYIQILKGVYQGIRNPKAHSLETDLSKESALQYLVLASLLARRIDEATVVENTRKRI